MAIFGLHSADRLPWVWLSRLRSHWRSALLMVKPETVIAWHRKGFRIYLDVEKAPCYIRASDSCPGDP